MPLLFYIIGMGVDVYQPLVNTKNKDDGLCPSSMFFVLFVEKS